MTFAKVSLQFILYCQFICNALQKIDKQVFAHCFPTYLLRPITWFLLVSNIVLFGNKQISTILIFFTPAGEWGATKM